MSLRAVSARGDNEADIVERLRAADALRLGCLAVRDGDVLAHVAFSPVTIDRGEQGALEALGLGPVAVSPEHQREGIGTRLIARALAGLRCAGIGAVFVLGHQDYYPRFGFTPTAPRSLAWEHPAAPEAFMALELEPGALAGVEGTVRYHPAFSGVCETSDTARRDR